MVARDIALRIVEIQVEVHRQRTAAAANEHRAVAQGILPARTDRLGQRKHRREGRYQHLSTATAEAGRRPARCPTTATDAPEGRPLLDRGRRDVGEGRRRGRNRWSHSQSIGGRLHCLRACLDAATLRARHTLYQGIAHSRRRRIALLAVLGHGAGDHRDRAFRHGGVILLDGYPPRRHKGGQGRDIGQQMVHGGTQTVDIGTSIGLRLAPLLGRGIVLGAHRDGIAPLPCLVGARDAKVDELDAALWSDHHVAGLQVAKDHRRGASMQIVENVAHLHGPVEHLPLHDGGIGPLQALLQRLAVHELHHQVRAAIMLKVGRHPGQVGVA